MKHLFLSTLIVTGIMSAQCLSADGTTSEMRDAARKVAITTCATCHGPQGRSISPKFPRLAGQNASYMSAQMKNFKARTRGDSDAMGYMWGMAAPLDDELISGLAEYYAAQRPAPGEVSDPATMTRGRAIYEQGVTANGVPACASCHGPGAAGTNDFPRLAGQSAQYLAKQLRAFHINTRNVAVMHGVTSGLSAGEMADVSAYLASLGS